MGKKQTECEVNINFSVPKEKIQHIYNARDELAKAGITFDTGGSSDGDIIKYDWEFDWSLKGDVKVFFRRYKDVMNVVEKHLTKAMHSDDEGRCVCMIGSQSCGKFDSGKCIA